MSDIRKDTNLEEMAPEITEAEPIEAEELVVENDAEASTEVVSGNDSAEAAEKISEDAETADSDEPVMAEVFDLAEDYEEEADAETAEDSEKPKKLHEFFSVVGPVIAALCMIAVAFGLFGMSNFFSKILGERILLFESDLIRVSADGKWGFINEKGEEKIPLQFDHAEDFTGEFALVCQGDQWGFVNTKGKVVIEPQFEKALPMTEGLAAVWTDGKAGFVNTKGKFVIEAQFDDAKEFAEGLACVKKDGKWGFINKKGKFVIEPQFDLAASFAGGVAPASAIFSIQRSSVFSSSRMPSITKTESAPSE